MLDQLAVLEHAASKLDLSSKETTNGVFGHLVFIARDMEADRAREVEHEVFDHEEVLAEGSPAAETALVLRNRTRAKLKQAFRSVKVFCLPQPHPRINGAFVDTSST